MYPAFNLHTLSSQLDAIAALTDGRIGAGRKFYVGNSTVLQDKGISASDQNNGVEITTPFATFERAMQAVTANRLDNIVLLPGHAETITADSDGSGFDMNTAGVNVIGTGWGTLMPTFTFTTATAADSQIAAANCSVMGVRFTCNIATQTAMMNISAADAFLCRNEFYLGTTTNDAALGILTTAAANRLYVKKCKFLGVNRGTAGAVDCPQAITIVGGDSIIIEECYMSGRFEAAVGAVEVITTATTNLRLLSCHMENYTTASEKCFYDTITGSTGYTGGHYYYIDGTGNQPETCATMQRGGGHYANAVNTLYAAFTA